jgi:hypothetical protein
MSALTNLINSDTLHFDSIELDLVGPPQAMPGHRDNKNRCVSKKVGELRFKLNSVSHLALSIPLISFEEDQAVQEIDVDIEFVAEAPMTTAAGELSITWKVDQHVDQDFKFSGYTVHVDRIEGSITTVVRPRNPRGVGTTCYGTGSLPRSIGVDLETIAGENKLTVRGSVSSGLLSGDAKITAENISIVGQALEEFTVQPKVHIPRNECGIGPRPGETFSAWGSVPAPPGSGPTYEWSITGAGSIKGTAKVPSVKIELDNSGQPIHLTLTCVVEGQLGTTTVKYTPETKESLRGKTLLCFMKRHLHVNLFVNPLWDPLRDYVARPPTRRELQRLERFGTDLAKQARALLARGR